MFLNADGRLTETGLISRCPAGCSRWWVRRLGRPGRRRPSWNRRGSELEPANGRTLRRWTAQEDRQLVSKWTSATGHRPRTCPAAVERRSQYRRLVKAVNDAAERGRLNVGGGASAVFERTLATFSAKNRLKDSASIAEFAGTRPRLTAIVCEDCTCRHQSCHARNPYTFM